MITPTFLRTMALYNQWQNENLRSHCTDLSWEELTLDRCMFFGSIFCTLNHILLVDGAIHHLIHTKVLPHVDLSTVLYSDYVTFWEARDQLDQRLVQEAENSSQAWLDETISMWSDRLQRTRKIPRGFYYVQMFNHQTHHRSQITSELHKMGIDYGSTDLPFNPYYDF